MRALKIILTNVIFIFMTINTNAPWSEELPDGWRLPREDELKSLSPSSIDFRKKSSSRFAKAEADFNGDGIQDKAYLLKSTRYNGQGLLVRMSLKENFKWIVLDEIKREKGIQKVGIDMGIDIVKPQRIRTACGKGYWECSEDEKPEITLKNPGIAYFHFEGAGSVFYWSQNKEKFLRVWTSD